MSLGAGFQSEADELSAFETYVEATEDDLFPGGGDDESESRKPRAKQAPDEDPEEGSENLEDDSTEDESAEAEDELPGDETDDQEASEEDDESGSPVDSIEALAEHFEVPADQVLENLMVEDFDGNELSIGAALESWRESETSIDERTAELEASYVTRRETQEAEINQQALQVMALANSMHQVLLRDFNPESMAAIQQEDPVRYAEMITRQHEMKDLIRQSIAAGESIGQQRQGEAGESASALQKREFGKMLRVKPEWRDAKRREAAMSKIGVYLTKHAHFSKEEVANITDHRIMAILDDAVHGRIARSGRASKKVKTSEELQRRGLRRPQGLKRSSRREQGRPRNQARKNSMAKLRKSGDAHDAVSLLMEHIED